MEIMTVWMCIFVVILGNQVIDGFGISVVQKYANMKAKSHEMELKLQELKAWRKAAEEELAELKIIQRERKNLAFATCLNTSPIYCDDSGLVAFHVGGKPTERGVIAFDEVYLNMGQHYSSTGYFTAPYPGVYSFSYAIDAGWQCETDFSRAELQVNERPISGVISEWVTGAGAAVTVYLRPRDKVAIYLTGCPTLYGPFNIKYHNTFSGHLVHRTV